MPKRYLQPKDWYEPPHPYSQGIQVGSWVFVAGQTSVNEKGEVVGKGDIRAQTRQVFENLKRILEEAGAKLEDVVKITVYVTDMRHYDVVREVRREYFKEHRPTSTLVEVKGLARPEFLIEVDAIAIKES